MEIPELRELTDKEQNQALWILYNLVEVNEKLLKTINEKTEKQIKQLERADIATFLAASFYFIVSIVFMSI